jgi:hypothetical protein
MALPPTTRVLLSFCSLVIGYAGGLAVLGVLRVLRSRYFGLFGFEFGFHAISFAFMSLLGWLLFLLPFVVTEYWRSRFQQPLKSAFVGGVAGSCLLTILLLSFLGKSAFAFPYYAWDCGGYVLCAFTIGSVSTGMYVSFRNRKELRRVSNDNVPE